ncbi:hypothetical protein EHI8A_082540 [Entamoeba histolytica HM-1:IMSS-B]|uniref:Uncharacterized protein n=6 Tax=Entamoeba histolytica TaxID=5759 RepID=C4M4H4_ENTH1|nr:hypothetical protein EHI_042200 [Entamoeba histolytica HM-1:IMSS]EMD42762.1 Hypothetical protein EHI5A_123380 [Entamoeba histolytica KU27]EMH72618.1 hypothetical protein EHI8A_082540 [Entamoeba histolytica HM-1:IMSS-B]EMS17474.1 hypothetical protein KM1_147520 [Entamoeba histolytica HM-3:IMSS]ENY64971.1 hypothetical protein EHI7A_080820 [Entamoeba histolytica HM-1:IMSS-A]GAT96273.1 hypothetical protein CL6EHI_042200 [Entamoeba histolytica]|eukprot:XP_656542.1 hypothetical protein EHI_042200 [Entamoeba histolytica HM-1:IMSS]
MAETPPILVGITKEQFAGVLQFEPNIEDGYDYVVNDEVRKRMLIYVVISALCPPFFFYIQRIYSKSEDPVIHNRYKLCLNIFAFEVCCLVIIGVVLFSWWFHDALE